MTDEKEKNGLEKEKWAIAYGLAFVKDYPNHRYDKPKGGIYALHPDTGESVLVANRPARVNSLCYVPGQGLYDTGVCDEVPYYEDWFVSGVTLTSEDSLLEKNILSLENEASKLKETPRDMDARKILAAKGQMFDGGVIEDLCFHPYLGLLATRRENPGSEIYLIVERDGTLTNKRLFGSRGDSLPHGESMMDFFPDRGVFCTYLDEIVHGLDWASYVVDKKIIPSKDETTFFSVGHLKYNLDLAYFPGRGLYVSIRDRMGSKAGELVHFLNEQGDLINRVVAGIESGDSRFGMRICSVPGRGLYLGSERIRKILDEKGDLIPDYDNDKHQLNKTIPGIDENNSWNFVTTSAICAIPMSFFENVKKHSCREQ